VDEPTEGDGLIRAFGFDGNDGGREHSVGNKRRCQETTQEVAISPDG
jgi:hypothetical protein